MKLSYVLANPLFINNKVDPEVTYIYYLQIMNELPAKIPLQTNMYVQPTGIQRLQRRHQRFNNRINSSIERNICKEENTDHFIQQ